MKRLGRIVHVSQSHNIIVKIEDVPKIGAKVVDENLRPIGKVLNILGPVSSPYASVQPETQGMGKSSGEMLYVLPKRRKRKG